MSEKVLAMGQCFDSFEEHSTALLKNEYTFTEIHTPIHAHTQSKTNTHMHSFVHILTYTSQIVDSNKSCGPAISPRLWTANIMP